MQAWTQRWLVTIGGAGMVAAWLGSGGCSPSSDRPPAAAAESPAIPAPAEPAAPPAPATLTDVNLAAADMGGAVEHLTGHYDETVANYGPGLTGRRLIDGLDQPNWLIPSDWSPNRMFNKTTGWVEYPVDIVLSFYERLPALVGAVTIGVPEVMSVKLVDDTSAAPKDVEVWTSMDAAPDSFTKAIAATLDTTPGEHTVEFPAREARFVRLRVLSGASQRVLEMAELRVLEAARAGYVPLFTRAPAVQRWKGSPREAAQRGLDWLQQSAVDWKGSNGCFGCHVQSQALMGQRVALQEGYRVSMAAVDALSSRIRRTETPNGTWVGGSELTSSVFGAMGLAHADEMTKKTSDPDLLRALDFVLPSQATDGAMPEPSVEPPIMQGRFMLTANTLVAMKWAATHSRDPKYARAADRAMSWIASHEPETTQDKVFKIIALMRDGTPEQKRAGWSAVETLAGEQQADGGWKEARATAGSNAFATGQVLYGFKQAAVSVNAASFRRGTEFLLRTQVNDPTPASGSWKAVHTQSDRRTDFAPTMWAVIGLAAAYGAEPTGAVQIVRRQGDRPVARNLEIVLDVSGSMNTTLGTTTRWQTALDVLREVVGELPDDLMVGLRVYGHRYPSRSAQTCQDTELIVPLAKLDRERIISAAAKLRPRGETPLVRSVLQTVTDLKAAGGGSVMLITDGEESCQGNAASAARQIKASGVHVSLNIVGFTVTGRAVEAELAALAGSTGGRYYSAQDGGQLSRAMKLAALQRLPYEILDASGRVVMAGETSDLSRELPPGQYRVRIDALGQRLEHAVTIAANQTTVVPLEVEGDGFVIRAESSPARE
jgi:hypothetical protein